MIKSHMPFDYLWQLLEYPKNTEDFYANKIEQSSDKKSYFNYPDSINAYDSQLENERLICSVNRIEKNGIKNLMTAEYLKYLKLEIENNERSQISTQFNQAMSDYNKGVKDLNDFVNYRNNKFSPSKNDSEVQNMMNLILSKFNDAKTRLLNIQTRDISINDQILASIISIEDAMKVADEQNSWLATYLKKGKLARKSIFYKVSWFGIPLN